MTARRTLGVGLGLALAILGAAGWMLDPNTTRSVAALLGCTLLLLVFYLLNREIRARERAEAQLEAGAQHEQAVRESETRYRAASELTSDYTYAFRIEPDGQVVVEWTAGAFTPITGFTLREVAARGGGISLVHPDDLPIALRRVQTLVSGQPDASEFRIITKSGAVRWVRENARPLWDAAQQRMRIYGAAQDITARKQAEEAAQRHQAELAHVLRVSTIGEMAAGLAHEINQPLSAIVSYAKGCARRMQTGSGQPDELLHAMEEIATQAGRADQIVRRLRDFVRKRAPRRERVDLNDLVREVARLIAGDVGQHSLTLRLELTPGLPPVEVDGIQIEQVVLNLVRNGIEAMQNLDAEQSVLSIRTAIVGPDAVEVAVCDAGEGLSVEPADQLFDPFFTTKPQGLGMGLSISRSIVEAHGGRLWATRNRERGTTFRFTVPVSAGEGIDAG